LLEFIEPVPDAVIRTGARVSGPATNPGALAADADETCEPASAERSQLASTPLNGVAQDPDPDPDPEPEPEPEPEPDPVPSLQIGLPVVGVMHV
jgi:hypothetical protein